MWRPPGEKWKGVLSVEGLAVIGPNLGAIYEAGADAILKCLEEFGVKANLTFYDRHHDFYSIDEDQDGAESVLSSQLIKMGLPDGTRGLLVFIPEAKGVLNVQEEAHARPGGCANAYNPC